MLCLNWVPTADSGITDAIRQPSRESVIQLQPSAFHSLRQAMAVIKFDGMISLESAHKDPVRRDKLPFFSQYHCEGASGADVMVQDILRLPEWH